MFMRSHIVLGIGVLSGTCISFRIRKSEYAISAPVDDQVCPEPPLFLHHDGTIMQIVLQFRRLFTTEPEYDLEPSLWNSTLINRTAEG